MNLANTDAGTAPNYYGISAAEIARICRVIGAIASYTKVSNESLFSRRRTARIARARQLAMTLIRRSTDLSLMEVGEVFHRDHGTVIHAMKTVDCRRLTDPGFDEDYENLLAMAKA